MMVLGRTRKGHHQSNIGTVLKAMSGKLLRDGMERIIVDFSEQIGTILN